MSRLPSLNGLRAFEAAARHLSFTKAAEELNVTQTAISHQIKRLEEELGLRLFIRQNRTLTLTAEARDYLPGIRAAFQDLRLATERLKRKESENALIVTTIASFAAKWLMPRLSRFQQLHPAIDVRVTTSTELADFSRDGVDVGIRYGHGKWAGLRSDWLMAEELFPVCSPVLLTGKHPIRAPEDLKKHTLLYSSHDMEDDWRLWLTAAGEPLDILKQPSLTFDMIFMTVQAAIDGLGVAVGRTAFVESDLAAGRLVAPFDVTLPIDVGFYLVCPEASADTPKIAAFREWLLATAQRDKQVPVQPMLKRA
ncbi:transcriptional regulator GcvA [Bradyrhizobium sp. LHD-71]|uniref:transcriptional regulator GcvA n=1 Tax=Bradyrhizobium sp. LHD-71 TaxID=3072141 RepID=UPI00280FA01E|nr:transcriptional regulator GcvA [Bradyrhizobium sp. LHD-71]MDQ8727151.1 transcriptional regulator GcvA [Bradyrhizobium sp. LHD-71]